MLRLFSIIVASLFAPASALAIEYRVTTPLPGFDAGVATSDIGSYIANIFQFGFATVGLVAFAMLIFNGVKYISGAGNESLVGAARQGISNVVWGILLLLASITILDTINPCILATVNYWRSRESISAQCGSGTGSVVALPSGGDNNQVAPKTREDVTLSGMVNGVDIRSQGNLPGSYYLDIFYVDKDSNEVRNVQVNFYNGRYQASIIEGDNILPSVEGDIDNFNFDPAGGAAALSKINAELDNFFQDRFIPLTGGSDYIGRIFPARQPYYYETTIKPSFVSNPLNPSDPNQFVKYSITTKKIFIANNSVLEESPVFYSPPKANALSSAELRDSAILHANSFGYNGSLISN